MVPNHQPDKHHEISQNQLDVVSIPLKNDGVRQIGSSSQLLGKNMFQTTNQDYMPLYPDYIAVKWLVDNDHPPNILIK